MNHTYYLNYGRGVLYLILSLLSSIIFPILCIYLIGNIIPITYLMDINFILIVSNGILFTVIYTFFGLFKKDTIYHLIIGCIYLIILLYFYTVGCNIFTLFFPHYQFGGIIIKISLGSITLDFRLQYIFIIIFFLLLKVINLIRHYIQPLKVNKE